MLLIGDIVTMHILNAFHTHVSTNNNINASIKVSSSLIPLITGIINNNSGSIFFIGKMQDLMNFFGTPTLNTFSF